MSHTVTLEARDNTKKLFLDFLKLSELEFCSTFLVLNDDPKSRSDSIETSKVDGKSLIGMLLEIGLY